MKILYDKNAREGIKKGIDECCDCVKVTLGHNGKNVLTFNGELTEIINDGVTIAKFVESKDETKMAGIRLAQQCASITDREAGDGTTTTLVLLQSALNELLSETQLDKPRKLRKKVLESQAKVIEKLEKSAKKVETKEDIKNVATTSSLDPKIGEMIAEIFWKLGKEANITIDETRYDKLEYKIVDGFQFDSKNEAAYSEDKEEYEDMPVIVFDKVVEASDIVKEVQTLADAKMNKLLIIGRDFTKDARALIFKFRQQQGFYLAAVKNMELNEEDLKSLGNRFDRVIVTQETTTLIGGNGDNKDYIKKLQDKKEKEESSYEIEKLDRRISKLLGGVAVITVGGQTDVEREERKLKVEDAIYASRNAYKYGIVKGGGLALKEAGEGEFIETICNAPYAQICENSEEEVEVGEDVVDSLQTVRESLKSALSVATSILTAEAALIVEQEHDC